MEIATDHAPSVPHSGSPAAAMLAALEQKVLSGDTPDRGDWERFQIGLLKKNMEIAESSGASARVKADAVGKMLWATQMNLERSHAEEKLRDRFDLQDALDERRTERRMDYEKAMKGHRWRTAEKKQWQNKLPLPERQTFAIPPYQSLYRKWPLKDGAPPLADEEFDGEAVPRWVCESKLGRPLEADDLPDEVYWFGRRPPRFDQRQKEPLFRVVKFRGPDGIEEYRKTKRGNEEFPLLGGTEPNRRFVMLRDDEVSEHEAKVFGEQPPVRR